MTEYNAPPPGCEVRHRGRKPHGERALTGAERQARYRQRQADIRAAPARRLPRPPLGKASRPQQWRAAVATLLRLQAEYAAWLEALPEALRDGATGEALQAIVDLDLDVSIGAQKGPRIGVQKGPFVSAVGLSR